MAPRLRDCVVPMANHTPLGRRASWSPDPDDTRSLLQKILGLRKGNHDGSGQFFLLETLRQMLSETVIEAAFVEHHQKKRIKKTRDYYKQLRASLSRTPKSAYIFQNLPITFAILALSEEYEAIDWFWQNRETDRSLPFESAERLKSNRFLVNIEAFIDGQRQFPPKITPDMREIVWEKYILPFTQMDTVAQSQGINGESFHVTIDPEYDGLHDSGRLGATPGHHTYFLKVIDLEDIEIERVEEEILTLEYLERFNTNIVRLLTKFQYGNKYYLIFPLADGDLEGYMKQTENPTPDFLTNLTMSLIRCLKVLHYPGDDMSGSSTEQNDKSRAQEVLVRVLHRDLCLQNILYKCRDDGIEWILGDFGLSKIIKPEGEGVLTVHGVFTAYAAPEVKRGEIVGSEADVWSVGCILLDVLSYALYGYDKGYVQFRARRFTRRADSAGRVSTDTAFHDGQGGLKEAVMELIHRIESEYAGNDTILGYLKIVKEMMVPKMQRPDARYFEGEFSRLFPGHRASVPSISIQQDDLGISIPGHANNMTGDISTVSGGPSSFPPSGYHIQQPRIPRRPRNASDAGRSPSRRSTRRSNSSISGIPNHWSNMSVPQFGDQPPPDFDQLAQVDTLFLVDDQPWMDAADWDLAGQALEKLLRTTLEHTPYGVGLDFVSSGPIRIEFPPQPDIRSFMETFHRHTRPDRKAIFGQKIDGLIGGRINDLRNSYASGQLMRGLNIIVLTNGAFLDIPDQAQELETELIECVKELEEYRYIPRRYIGLQFVKLNATQTVEKSLDHLDNNFHQQNGLRRDIIDTRTWPTSREPTIHELHEILLGAILKSVDDRATLSPSHSPRPAHEGR